MSAVDDILGQLPFQQGGFSLPDILGQVLGGAFGDGRRA